MRMRLTIKGMGLLGLLLLLLAAGTGCSSMPVKPESAPPVKRPASTLAPDDATYAIDAYDPWEGFNRHMYVFNTYFDQYVFLPVVRFYETILPDYVEDRISSFFANLGELKNLTNTLLQVKPKGFTKTAGRIVINTTLGAVGLWDPATAFGIARQNEDFGQSLGHYGLGAGPYLVLPILGPSSLRDTFGLAVDGAVSQVVMSEVYDGLDLDSSEEAAVRAGLTVVGAVDQRHRQSFRYYETGSPFEYELIRLLYLKKRVLEVNQ